MSGPPRSPCGNTVKQTNKQTKQSKAKLRFTTETPRLCSSSAAPTPAQLYKSRARCRAKALWCDHTRTRRSVWPQCSTAHRIAPRRRRRLSVAVGNVSYRHRSDLERVCASTGGAHRGALRLIAKLVRTVPEFVVRIPTQSAESTKAGQVGFTGCAYALGCRSATVLAAHIYA